MQNLEVLLIFNSQINITSHFFHTKNLNKNKRKFFHHTHTNTHTHKTNSMADIQINFLHLPIMRWEQNTIQYLPNRKEVNLIHF